MTLLTLLINVIPALLRFGTLLGKDAHFHRRDQELLHDYVVVGISAMERAQLMEVFNSTVSIEDTQERYFRMMSLQAQAIALSLRNKRGYFVFDSLNEKHLRRIIQYPDRVLEDWLCKIAELSDMPWFNVRQQGGAVNDESDSGDTPANPS